MRKLYILVRTDLASMNSGRTAAQCAHAANYFIKAARELIEYLEDPNDEFTKAIDEWENQTVQGYGTTIVLDGGSEEDIKEKMISIDGDYFSAAVIDPEYPIVDGSVVHILPDILTCAFAFPYNEDIKLKDLKLYGKD